MDSVEEGSERSIQLGGSYIAEPDIFPENADYVALGHIHKPQHVPGHPKIRYSGSPIEYRKGEERYTKQVVCVDLEVGKEPVIEKIPLKQYKPIEVWRCACVTDAMKMCGENSERNCWVYLEIQTDRAILEDEIKQMKQLKSDILEIHPILQKEDEEEERMSWKDRPFREIFREFYKHEKGVEASEELLQTLMSLLGKEETDEAD